MDNYRLANNISIQILIFFTPLEMRNKLIKVIKKQLSYLLSYSIYFCVSHH